MSDREIPRMDGQPYWTETRRQRVRWVVSLLLVVVGVAFWGERDQLAVSILIFALLCVNAATWATKKPDV